MLDDRTVCTWTLDPPMGVHDHGLDTLEVGCLGGSGMDLPMREASDAPRTSRALACDGARGRVQFMERHLGCTKGVLPPHLGPHSQNIDRRFGDRRHHPAGSWHESILPQGHLRSDRARDMDRNRGGVATRTVASRVGGRARRSLYHVRRLAASSASRRACSSRSNVLVPPCATAGRRVAWMVLASSRNRSSNGIPTC